MTAGKVLRVKFITRQMVESAPNTIFVFGDNMLRVGMGGQAGAMRGCRNAMRKEAVQVAACALSFIRHVCTETKGRT